jgi:hypothetical protein
MTDEEAKTIGNYNPAAGPIERDRPQLGAPAAPQRRIWYRAALIAIVLAIAAQALAYYERFKGRADLARSFQAADDATLNTILKQSAESQANHQESAVLKERAARGSQRAVVWSNVSVVIFGLSTGFWSLSLCLREQGSRLLYLILAIIFLVSYMNF